MKLQFQRLLLSEYYEANWTQNDAFFTVGTLGYQIMTIPETSLYRIIACGAGYENGNGAVVRSKIHLKQGNSSTA